MLFSRSPSQSSDGQTNSTEASRSSPSSYSASSASTPPVSSADHLADWQTKGAAGLGVISSLASECTPLKHRYDACFDLWFRDYLAIGDGQLQDQQRGPSIGSSEMSRPSDSDMETRKRSIKERYDHDCGALFRDYQTCVKLQSEPHMTSDDAEVPAYPTQGSSDAQVPFVGQHGPLPPYSASAGPSGSNGVMAESREDGDFFDIAPRNDSTSFQVGYLGLKGFEAWVKGDVLVKLDSDTKRKGAYTRCTVQLKATESVNDYNEDASSEPAADVVELFSHSYTLWDVQEQSSSGGSSSLTPPSAMPFSFPLTSDLPHCVHLRHSSLTYQIVAKLLSADTSKLPDAVKTIPVHLVRYTRPGPLDQVELAEIDGAQLPDSEFSLSPRNWVVETPTTAYVQINRSIFRRAEPIDIRVHIPPPHPTSMAEKGLKLRAVEADLVRIISVKKPVPSSADKSATHLDEAVSHSDPAVHEALLAHSGKLCRFHSQRPVLLRLTLHPPFDRANMPHPHPDHDALASGPVFGRGGGGGCESISQETLMHKVSFEVRIKIGIQGGQGERRDIVCRKTIKILPGAAGALEGINGSTSLEHGQHASSSEKEKLKQSDKVKAVELEPSSSSRSVAADLLDFGMEDEYDGYEDVGRSLDEVDGVDAHGESSSTHEERLEQLRQLLEQSDSRTNEPPPTLLESQHDLQVEVELEGVGLAMPRHPSDTYPRTAQDEFLSPPPPMDDHDDEHEPVSAEANEPPPPPISPLAHTDLHHPDDYELTHAGAAATAESETTLDTASSTAGRHEPPPYLYGEAVPTFDQAIRQQRTQSTFHLPRGTGPLLFQRRDVLHPIASGDQASAPQDRTYARPPAYYGTSPHPPSYDA